MNNFTDSLNLKGHCTTAWISLLIKGVLGANCAQTWGAFLPINNGYYYYNYYNNLCRNHTCFVWNKHHKWIKCVGWINLSTLPIIIEQKS